MLLSWFRPMDSLNVRSCTLVSAACTAAAAASSAAVGETLPSETSRFSVCARSAIWYSMDSAYISCSAVAERPVASTVTRVSRSSALH